MKRALLSSCLVVVWLVAGANHASAQAQYQEGFESLGGTSAGNDGPDSLIAKGWIFRNQSEPKGTQSWKPGTLYSAFEGSGYLSVDDLSTHQISGGKVSNWAILPQIPNQQAGDQFTVYLRDLSSSQADRLELRYSPGAGTSTGSGATAVGDFTTALAVVDPLPTGAWTPLTVTLPGAGRIALRYAIDFACGLGCSSAHLGIDSLSVGASSPPPCGLVLPTAGQTVTWTAAGNPHQVCTDLLIPTDATLILDPGVVVDIGSGNSLVVDGTVLGRGNASSPVTINGINSTVSPPLDVRGTVDLEFCTVAGRIYGRSTASILVSDCDFPGGIVSTAPALVTETLPFVSVARSSFVGGEISVTDGALMVVESSFSGVGPFLSGGIQLLRGYLYLDGVVIDGAALTIIRERYAAPAYLNGLLVINNTSGPALRLEGWNFAVGDNVVLANNLVPMSLTGGLVEGTQLSATTNLGNYVDVGDGGVRGQCTWPDVGVPYVVNGNAQTGGALLVGPGAEVLLNPGSSVTYISTGNFQVRGTPDDPARFGRFVPSSAWQTIQFASQSTAPRFEYAEIEGAAIGVLASDAHVQVENSRLLGNEVGAASATFGSVRVRGSQFLGNLKGVRTSSGTGSATAGSASNPNAFVGNTLAIESNNSSTVPAANSWWGDPSGPTATSNPAGTGDAISGPVSYQPFLTQAPAFTDRPPRVQLMRLSGPLEIGSKVIVHWEVEDEGPIQKQQILFSEHGHLSYSLVADDLPGAARSFEWTVPAALPSSNNNPSFLKVVAFDQQGQTGFDEQFMNIPYTADVTGNLTFTTALQPSYKAGDTIEVCYQWIGQSGTTSHSVQLLADENGVGQGGGHTGISCVPGDVTMPWVSTDNARVSVSVSLGAGNRTLWFFSDEFEVRPDARIGDQPPVVQLTSPAPGQVFSGGDLVPIQWTAADDEGLRSVFIQASYDGGRGWHRVTRDLPAGQTSYAWRLPASTGMSDVRVRVVATDVRFQNSSDTIAAPIQITPGTGAVCQLDLGFGGPGPAHLSMCGQVLSSGNSADLLLEQAKPLAPALLLTSTSSNPTPAFGGTLVPLPLALVLPVMTNAGGTVSILGVPGGAGAFSVFAQAVVQDASQPLGAQISNALRIDFLP